MRWRGAGGFLGGAWIAALQQLRRNHAAWQGPDSTVCGSGLHTMWTCSRRPRSLEGEGADARALGMKQGDVGRREVREDWVNGEGLHGYSISTTLRSSIR